MAEEFTFKGVEIAPSGRNRPDTKRNLHRIHGVASGKDRDSGAEEPMAGQVCVFENSSGEQIAVLPSNTGPCQVDWISGSEVTSLSEDLSRGMLIPLNQIARASQAAPKRKPTEPSNSDIKDALMQAFKAAGMVKGQENPEHQVSLGRDGANDRDDREVFAKTDPMSAPNNQPQGDSEDKKELLDGLPGAAQSVAANALATYLGNGVLTAGNLVQGLAGGLTSMGVEFLMGRLLGGAPDDSASTTEWAMSVVGPQMAKQMLVGPLGSVMGKWLNNTPYSSQALRVGDSDTGGNGIIEGSPDVIIEGLCAAREGDALDKKGVPVGMKTMFGAKMVQINQKPSARADNPNAGYGTVSDPANLQFLVGASKTYIGGVTTCPNPPPLAEFAKATGMASPHDPGKPNPVADPAAPMPKERGMYWSPNKDDPTVGEWRMWDPDFGWSASPSEAFSSNAFFGDTPDWTAGRDSFLDNKYNPIFKLGTPEWPGAGQGSSWWVPDEFFPGLFSKSKEWNVDMKKSFSNLHDWLFEPENLELSLPRHLLKTEWRAFSEGFSGSYNPLKWLFKGVYSSATTAATFVFHFNSILDKKLDLELLGRKAK